MRKLDVLIVPGTGILDDFGERPLDMPYALFCSCLAARLWGVKLGFVSIGAGPIRHPMSRWLMKSAAALAHYRSYRDRASKTFMQQLGSDVVGDPVYPDIAFALPSPEQPAPHCSEGRAPTIGVGIMAYWGWRNLASNGAHIYAAYLDVMARFVVSLLDRGYRVRLLVGDTIDQIAIEDLGKALRPRMAGLPAGRLITEPTGSLHDLMRQIAETDAVVATRFHNIVCALKLAKPTLSIGYAKKNEVLMQDMGLGAFCQHVEHLDPERLMAQFDALMAGREDYARTIDKAAAAIETRLKEQEMRLATLLLQ